MKLPKDKLLHLIVSAGLLIALSFLLSWIAAVIITLLIGIAKELADKYGLVKWLGLKKTGFSYDDLLFDCYGIITGSVLFAVIGSLIGW